MSDENGLGGGLPVVSWFDEPIKKSIRSVFDGINDKVESLDLLRKYRSAHFKSLRDAVSTVKILGMSEPVPLTSIYSPARASTTIHRRLYNRETVSPASSVAETKTVPLSATAQEGSLVSADAFIESHERVVVLGGPGSGKTTLLRHVALAYSDKSVFAASQIKTSRFPFYVSLPILVSSGKSLETFLEEELTARTDGYAGSFLRRLFKNGMAALMLDSLDEVAPTSRPAVVKTILEFCNTFPDVKYVISCRTADYQEWLPNFYEIELAKLSRSAANKIIRCWFSADPRQAEKLIRHLKADKGVASLTETPLLLSLLCIQFRHDLTLPQRKTELYRRCVDTLLRDWDTGRGFRRDTAYAKLSDDRKQRVFEAVAGAFFTDQPRYVFPAEELKHVVGSTALLFDLETSDADGIVTEVEQHHGIIEKSSMESYCFSHPSFQEYFAARHFIETRQEIPKLRRHYDDDIWSPVIEFMVSLRPDPSDLLDFLVAKSTVGVKTYPAMGRRTRHLWLLYRCLAMGPALHPDAWRRLNRHLYDSQVEMMRVYRQSRIVPIASLLPDGIKHAFYTYGARRETLMTALQPFRQLANEILLSPSARYAQVVLESIDTIDTKGLSWDDDIAIRLALLLPIAAERPSEVGAHLKTLRQRAQLEFVKKTIEQSERVLAEKFAS